VTVAAGVPWAEIPAGPFTMGSDPAGEFTPAPDEAPRHRVELRGYRLARTAVTNADYRRYVEAAGASAPGSWPRGAVPAGTELHPVTYVSFDDALGYCRWAGATLPSEPQWERAARGDDDRLWPWGNTPPDARHAVFARGIGGPAPTGGRARGASPCGALDLAGNVQEWTASVYGPYPWSPQDARESPDAAGPRTVRGGSYLHGPGELRCSARQALERWVRDPYVGFRVVAGRDSGHEPLHGWVDVPAGSVLLGNEPRAPGGPALPDEVPQHVVDVPAFAIALTPVTNADYADFVAATGHPAPCRWRADPAPALAEHPVTHVDWHDARAFCAWAGARLPTEAEWEKAARGTDARRYPWGAAEPDDRVAVFARGTAGQATEPVGTHPAGASPYGVLDVAGTVWEWTSSAYRAYPYRVDDGREEPESGEERVLRGGSYASPGGRWLRCASRSRSFPTRRQAHIGFRVARAAS
jgi:formylglycine-generating enzyme required for sulfatase activity